MSDDRTTTAAADGRTADETWLDRVLADTADPGAHRQHHLGDAGPLLGPLVVPASGLERFRDALPAGSHGLEVLLVADAADDRDGLTTLREARNGLFDDDRVELVGVRLALPAASAPDRAAAQLLDALDFSVPAWVEVPPVAGWEGALEVLAEDGTENAAVRAGTDAAGLAGFLRRVVDLGLRVQVAGPVGAAATGDTTGLVNLLCATWATLDGAPPAHVAQVLRDAGTVALAERLRRADALDAAAVRAVLASVDCADVPGTVEDLRALGLV